MDNIILGIALILPRKVQYEAFKDCSIPSTSLTKAYAAYSLTKITEQKMAAVVSLKL